VKRKARSRKVLFLRSDNKQKRGEVLRGGGSKGKETEKKKGPYRRGFETFLETQGPTIGGKPEWVITQLKKKKQRKKF